MSRLMLSPNYCSCTVNRARNLPDKGKNGGPDAFCVISMGKEKFVTAVQEKNSSPDWHEQCDMPVADDATIKLTVYHSTKSSLTKGDFIGRANVPIRDLHDYDRVHTTWYPLMNKDGRVDKDRGEIEVSLQFYSKNNNTGSVLDLATKKKHLSLKDIKHSLGDRLKAASKHRRHDKYAGENQLADQQRRLDGENAGSHNGRDFLEDSISDTTSFSGSHMSLNSMSFNNNPVEQPRKKSRAATSNSLGATLGSVTPYSSRRSVTSDYETSSILDSASMYGADDVVTQSPFDRPQPPQPQQHREVSVDNNSTVTETPKQRKKKEPAPTKTIPTIVARPASSTSSVLPENDQNFSVTGDDIEAAFDSIKDYRASISKPKEPDTADTSFGLSTINEQLDTEDSLFGSSQRAEEEDIDFDHYFDKFKPQSTFEEKKPKRTAPISPAAKTTLPSTFTRSDDIYTPSTSISVIADTTVTSPPTLSARPRRSEEKHDSTDDDIDEIIGKLERVSSVRSIRRKIQPTQDITQPSFFEADSKPSSVFGKTSSAPKKNPVLPDIVIEQPAKRSAPPAPSNKTGTATLSVLGYENVKSTSVNPKIRQELDYLDREELLQVIAHQSDLIKKRDSRVKDLEQYTDGLLVKIVEQCPSILQSGNMKFNHK